MDISPSKYFIRQGIILGLIQVTLYYLIYFIKPELLASFAMGFCFILLVAIYPVIIVVRYKRNQENFISLKDAFQISFFTIVLRGLIALIFTVLLFSVIDHNLASFLKEKTIQNTTQLMQQMGSPEDKINEAVDRIQDMDKQFTASGQIKGFTYNLIVAVIYSLIIAAIVKKDKSPFVDQPTDAI